MGNPENLTPYIKVRKDDLRPATPRLFLQVTARRQLTLTLPYVVDFTIRRAKKDGSDRPCIFRWHPLLDSFSSQSFIVLHHTATGDGVEPCAVDHTKSVRPPLPKEKSISMDRNSWDDHLWELLPGGEGHGSVNFPEHYYQAMRAGETYTLLYPGGEVAMWDWGTRLEHFDKQPKARYRLDNEEMLPALMIPGGAYTSLDACEEETPWPERAASLSAFGFDVANKMEKRWREQEALKSMRVIEGWALPLGPKDRCRPTVTIKGVFHVKINVTYTSQVCGPDGQPSAETTTRPITFCSWAIIGLHDGWGEGFRLYRRRGGGGDDDGPWEGCDMDDGAVGFQIYDLPDVAVRVAEHKHFTALKPGEAWTTTKALQGQAWSCLPDDTAVGDLFLYGFSGAVVDWWDWGDAEEHAETVVTLPCWIAGRVTGPSDNGGRSKLVVTHSEPVEFTTKRAESRAWRPPHEGAGLGKQSSNAEEVHDGIDEQEVNAAEEGETPPVFLVAGVVGESIGEYWDD
ncbi:hypothetical protein C8A01DRAFT_45595 [Parachaetomium inaequale]|uniref:Uncharacterized protein n=1 Tax=Parachaetomium inaequale TaxID=2588326 RepID=A0AAN6ST79_9PEZI|nr:hypothetical protein C8A01DRAFT_45595 [Parachaetomium inaequale]